MNSYSSEQLSKVSNELLRKEFLNVRASINISKKNKIDTVELEIYYCYVIRELNSRESLGGKKRKLVQPIKK